MSEEAGNLDIRSEEGVEQMFDSCCYLESTWGFLAGNYELYEVSEAKRDDTLHSQLVIRTKCRSDAFKIPPIRLTWSEMRTNFDCIISRVIFI